ncbi:MAG TPA: hypothetical protein VD962_06575 [Rubricoccaceae bacterium]|nr:hypothetical protein [Rubricoccaceae bacterium]
MLGLWLGGATAAAQVDFAASVGGGYLDFGDVGRFGVATAVYISFADHALDLVPNAEYYYGKWSVDSDTPAETIYAVGLDGHANLPPLANVLRPYVGTGVSYARHGGEGGVALDLKTGAYVRATWSLHPYAQVTYRVVHDFETVAPLDVYFLQGGLRVDL